LDGDTSSLSLYTTGTILLEAFLDGASAPAMPTTAAKDHALWYTREAFVREGANFINAPGHGSLKRVNADRTLSSET
jgi:hypothetical protein